MALIALKWFDIVHRQAALTLPRHLGFGRGLLGLLNWAKTTAI